MQIHHIAFWSHNIDRLSAFYVDIFNAKQGNRFEDERKFCSYFISFDNGCALEIMQIPGVLDRATPDHDDIHHVGLHHFALSVSSKEEVHATVQKAVASGSKLIKEPNATEDGFFEAMVTDPDGNLVEIAYIED